MENKIIKKSPGRKFRLIFISFIFVILLFSLPLIIKSTYPSKSDIVIKQVIAEKLNKDPNELTKDDFIKVTKLNISGKELSDIRLLKKCINLEELSLMNIHKR